VGGTPAWGLGLELSTCRLSEACNTLQAALDMKIYVAQGRNR
jgi:hypothetical protein